MVKELEYMVPQVPNPKVYYFIYLLQKMFHNRICSTIVVNYDKPDDFEQMWKIKIYGIQTSKKISVQTHWCVNDSCPRPLPLRLTWDC